MPRTFSPILESDDASANKSLESVKASSLKRIDPSKTSKTSLKGSKVSFEQPGTVSSDEDSFEDRREHFQQKKAISTAVTDHKGILKVRTCIEKQLKFFTPLIISFFHRQDLNSIRANNNRRAFQSKKHVSLDIKSSRVLERILRGSSSEEEEEDFDDNRKHFQARKHQSLDARSVKSVGFTDLKKGATSSEDEEAAHEGGKLIKEKIYDFSKPIVIDYKDLDISEESEEEDDEDEEGDHEEEDEDFVQSRRDFQRQKAISVESRKRYGIVTYIE